MSTSITSGPFKQIVRFGSDAIEKVLEELGLDKKTAQLVVERGGEFAADIRSAAATSLRALSVTDRYKDEEVRSTYRYPPEYKGPKPIEEQIKAIAAIFDLDPAAALVFAKNLPPLPAGAEGYFAIPSVDALAKKHFPTVTDAAEQYCRVVQLVLEKIAAARKFYNYREGELGSDCLKQHERTARMLAQLAKNQPGDILIIAAQLALRHRGRSTRRAREVFAPHEFGLGTVAVGSILLTHPERIVRYEELDMDCAGDEYSPYADGVFDGAPIFYYYLRLPRQGLLLHQRCRRPGRGLWFGVRFPPAAGRELFLEFLSFLKIGS